MAEENTKKQAQNTEQPKKLSYEELARAVDFYQGRLKQLQARVNQDAEYIATLETQNLFSYMNYLFKVIDSSMFSAEFTQACIDDVTNLMGRLHTIMVPKEKEEEESDDAASSQAE